MKLSGLKPRAVYHYTVSNGAGGAASAMYNFTAPYSSADVTEMKPTKIGAFRADDHKLRFNVFSSFIGLMIFDCAGIFGDMGVYTHNNMANLLEDHQAGKIDVLLHMGDHAYNMGDHADARGDGYMNAYQKVLTQVANSQSSLPRPHFSRCRCRCRCRCRHGPSVCIQYSRLCCRSHPVHRPIPSLKRAASLALF